MPSVARSRFTRSTVAGPRAAPITADINAPHEYQTTTKAEEVSTQNVAVVASGGGRLRGGLVLAVFGMGAAAPLVAVAYVSRSRFERASNSVLARLERVRLGFALVLGGMGVAILTRADKNLEAIVLSWLPDARVNFTVGI